MTRMTEATQVQMFEAYVDSFYNENTGIYPIAGLTDKMISSAVEKHIKKAGWWFCGDSVDREAVRELILISKID